MRDVESLRERLYAILETAERRHALTGRPLVTLSYAQSLDGSIAGPAGERLPLSCPEALVLTHELRAAHDAILVGVGTVVADDPRLTVRLAPGDHPQPVVVDSHLRIPDDCYLLQTGPRRPWIAAVAATAERQAAVEARGATILQLPPGPDGIDLAALLDRLGALGVRRLMVEGGARIIRSCLADGLVDQLVLTISPCLIGGMRPVTDGSPGAVARPAGTTAADYAIVGRDIVVRVDLCRVEV